MANDVARSETGFDIEGTRIRAAVERALTPKGTDTAAKSSPTSTPIPNNPVLVAQNSVTKKGRIRGEFSLTLPDNTTNIEMIICPTALRTSDAAYKAGMISNGGLKVDRNLLADNAGLYLVLFSELLETTTQYDVIQLIARVVNNEGEESTATDIANPETLPAFNTPLPSDPAQQWQFTTGALIGGPSDPASNLITINRLDPLTKAFDAEIALRVYAPLDSGGNAVSWQNYLGGDVICVVDFGQGPDHGTNYTIGQSDTLTDPASPVKPNRGYVDIPRKGLIPGASAIWIKNILNISGEKMLSAITNINFFCGNRNISIQTLTAVNLVTSASDPNDAKHQKLSLEFQQPAGQAVAPKNVTVFMKLHGDPDANYRKVVDRFTLKEDDFSQPGTLYSVANGNAIVLDPALKMKASNTYDLQLTLKAIGDIIYFNPLPSTLPVFTVGAGASPDVANDTAIPTVQASQLAFIEKSDLHIVGLKPTSNFNLPTANGKYVVIYDGGSNYLDINTYLSTFNNPSGPTIQFTTEANARFVVGDVNKVNVPVKLKHLRSLFGAAAIIQQYWYAENQAFGLSLKSPNASLDLSKPFDYLDSKGAVNATNVGQSMISTINELHNGHFHLARSGGACKFWSRSLTPGDWIPAVGGSTGLDFDSLNHRIHWYGLAGGQPTQQLGDPAQVVDGFNVDAGDYKTVGVTLYSNNGQHTLSLQIAVRDQLANAVVTVPFTATINSTPTLYQIKFQIPPSYTFTGATRLLLRIEDPGNDINALNDLFADLAGMNTGQQFTGYTPAALRETNGNGDEVWSTAPNPATSTGVFTVPNVSPTGPPVGTATQGGGAAIGFGRATDFLQ